MFVDLRHAGFRWTVARGHESAVTSLPDWSHERLRADPACRILKQEPKRFAGFIDLGGRSYFFKSQAQAARGFAIYRRSGGRKEWDQTLFARSKGLPVAAPIAIGERREFFGTSQTILVSQRVDQPTLAAWVEDRLRDGPGSILPVAEALGGFLRRLHETGMLHWDLHPGNVLFRLDAAPEFTLIDLKSGEIGDAPRDRRLENVAKSILLLRRFGVLAPWRPAAQEAYLRGYLRGEGRPDDFLAELAPCFAKRGRMMTDHLRRDFDEGGPRFDPRVEGPLRLYVREDRNRNVGLDLLPEDWRTAAGLLRAADSAEGRAASSTRPGWSLFLRRIDARSVKPFWFHALRGAALPLPMALPLALVEEDGTARALCLAAEGDLGPATGGAATAGPFADALHALDFSAAGIEARHLRIRTPRSGDEQPALVLVCPEAAANRPGLSADERRSEKERLGRILYSSPVP